ncbi:putative cation exchanger C521.04c isoform X2 [Rhinatrema bivittatum]|uniref:putative cation exchanger C521.04c isoform X2 n=1 Tax=Rhinatrema bivittatum TaxID=194408 RepID=UPI00112AAA2B|nr:putative cation exchanger C521.04c isoform X2 [Rhinatrema bivittatum]
MGFCGSESDLSDLEGSGRLLRSAAAMSAEAEYTRRRRFTHDAFDFPKEFEHRAEAYHRRGSLCDRHCTINLPTDLDMHSGSHQHSLLVPRLLPVTSSTPTHCPHNSEEAPICEGCLTKTTLTAENEVEAHKLSNNYKFGFKKWKSHVTERPWEDRSEIVKELYSDLNVLKGSVGSTFTCGNVLYLLMFGWWLSLFYLLVSLLMFVSILGAPYGKLCWKLASYFLWPFGKAIQKSRMVHRRCCVRFNKCEAIPEADELREKTPLIANCESAYNLQKGSSVACGVRYWCRISTYVWLLLGFPPLAVVHGLVCFFSWILVFFIPIAKMSARTVTTILLMPPERVHIQQMRKTDVGHDTEVILCCYHALNIYYYKYTIDGISVFAVNLMLLVIVTLALGYSDSQNQYSSSPVKFTLSLVSIVPLSYCIGMAIASISAQSSFALGAVVNATFGSIIELTFYIAALIKGAREGNLCYEEVVKSALTGTVLGCVLFVPGLCMVIGGIKHQEQRFNSRSAGVSSALLFISVGGIFAPTMFSKVYGKLVCGDCWSISRNSTPNAPQLFLCQSCQPETVGTNSTLFYKEVMPLVYTVSGLLPTAYIIGLVFTLKTHSHIYDIHISDCHVAGHHHSAVVHWSRWRSVIVLILATLCMSACADLATEHISPILSHSSVSQYFIGVTVLAMIPELPEIVNGIQFALQNNISLSLEIGSSIAIQVCMLQIPILVLFNIFYPTGFTLLFSDLHVWASIFSVILMNYIFMDGKCDYFQGTVLVMVYLILLAMYFYAPSPAGC